MTRVRSDALEFVSRALGLGGVGAATTEFEDEGLIQTLDVSSLIRRGRTEVSTHGIHIGIIRNIHTAANSVETNIDPYNVGVGPAIPPYPPAIGPGFDLWLIGATVRRISGTGTYTGVLYQNLGASGQGFGIDSVGADVVNASDQPLAHWDSFLTEGTNVMGLSEAGQPYIAINMRLPRRSGGGTTIVYQSTSSAIMTDQVQLIMGLFPVAMGQDVAF